MTRRFQSIGLLVGLAAVVLPVVGPAADVSQGAIQLVRSAEQDISAQRGKAAIEKLQQAADMAPEWYVPPARLATAYQICGMETAALQQYMRVQRISLERYDPGTLIRKWQSWGAGTHWRCAIKIIFPTTRRPHHGVLLWIGSGWCSRFARGCWGRISRDAGAGGRAIRLAWQRYVPATRTYWEVTVIAGPFCCRS